MAGKSAEAEANDRHTPKSVHINERQTFIRFSGAADVRGETVYQNGGKKSVAKWREESK